MNLVVDAKLIVIAKTVVYDAKDKLSIYFVSG